MKKAVVSTTAVILGVVVGAGIGGYFSFARYSREYRLVRAFAWTELTFAVSQNEFDSRSSQAERALSNELSVFEGFAESASVEQATKDAIQMNVGRIEAELSVLENEAGNANQAAEYMTEAQKNLKAVGWINYSKNAIIGAFDRQAVRPCANSVESGAKSTALGTRNRCR